MSSEEDLWRWTKTTAVLLAITNAGLNLGILSPTFPDMAVLMSCSMGQMATTLTWVGLASIIGALAMGPLFDRFHSLLVLSVALVLQGLALGMAPWVSVLVVYQLITAVASIFFTGIMTGCLTANCIIWKEKPEFLKPIIQVTDLFHVFGMAIAPQLIEPYLVGKNDPVYDVIPTASTSRDLSVTATSYPLEALVTGNLSMDHHRGPEEVRLAYVLVAIPDAFIAVVCFVVFIVDVRRQKKSKSNDHRSNGIHRRRSYSLNEHDVIRVVADEFTDAHTERHRTSSLVKVVHGTSTEEKRTAHDIQRMINKRRELQLKKELRISSIETNRGTHQGPPLGSSLPEVTCNRRTLPLFLVVIAFLAISGGRDAMFTGLLFTFLNGYIGWTTSAATIMVTVYHVTRVVIHVVFVLLSKCVSPAILNFLNHIMFLLASLIMLFTLESSPIFTAVGIILTAFGTSNLHPTSITLAQSSFQVDGKVMGVLIGSIFFGTSMTSAIVGPLFDVYGAVAFPLILLSVTVIGFILFILWLIGDRSMKRNSSLIRRVYEEIVHTVDEKTSLLRSD